MMSGTPSNPLGVSQAPAVQSPPNAPRPDQFRSDPRVHYDRNVSKWQYEDENGAEYEWAEAAQVWIPIVTDELLKAQQAAYAVQGVDEEAPVAPKQHILNQRKRKQAEVDYTSNDPIPSAGTGLPPPTNSDLALASSSKTYGKPPKAPRPITDVYVTNLPPGTTAELLASTFSRAGLLMTDDEGNPKVKLYTDSQGNFKGDALVSYFKQNSVDLACTLFDDTELVLGSGEGNIKVAQAEFKRPSREETKVKEKQADAASEGKEVKDAGVGVSQQSTKGKKKAPKALSEEQRRAAKRIRGLQSKLEDWSSADEEDPLAPNPQAPPAGNSRYARVVVLKHAFTLDELEADPGAAIELKEDIREEAESIGTVTNVTLYDKEEDGVITIKFRDAISAQACILKMNGRWFDGRQLEATIYTGKERFRQSGAGDDYLDPDEADAEERKRLDNFAAWLTDGPGEDGQPTDP